MKAKEIRQIAIKRIIKMKDEIKVEDMKDLHQLLQEADKKLWAALKDGELSYDQFKARVNKKMKRASYKVLEDLKEEGLQEHLCRDFEEAEQMIKIMKDQHRKGDFS